MYKQSLFIRNEKLLRDNLAIKDLSNIINTLLPKHKNSHYWLNQIDFISKSTHWSMNCDEDGIVNFKPNAKSVEALDLLKSMTPWRKGPYKIANTLIDSEWDLRYKWQRLQPYVDNVHNKTVLDIGASSGFFSFKLSLLGAKFIMALEPYSIFYYQFLLLNSLITNSNIALLPLRDTQLGDAYTFDTILSCGVLYHQKSPIEHLLRIKKMLNKSGSAIIETLVVDGDEGYSLMPQDTYANMANVWFIPSIKTMLSWLCRVGFSSYECVDVNETTSDEQKSTEWLGCNPKSLIDFVDFNAKKTNEGLPLPKRAVFFCSK